MLLHIITGEFHGHAVMGTVISHVRHVKINWLVMRFKYKHGRSTVDIVSTQSATTGFLTRRFNFVYKSL